MVVNDLRVNGGDSSWIVPLSDIQVRLKQHDESASHHPMVSAIQQEHKTMAYGEQEDDAIQPRQWLQL